MVGDGHLDASGWRKLVADLVIELHWSRDEVLDQIDIPFLEDLQRAWADWPPLRKVFAASLGHAPKPPASKNYHELLAMFPGGAIR
jgi:hypothetical protein